MISALNWGLWGAASALIVAIGIFIDRYHLSNNVKDSARTFLIKCFLAVERPKIPQFAQSAVGFLRKLWRSWWHLGLLAFMLFVYWAVVSVFYLGRIVLGIRAEIPYLRYVLTWIPFDNTAPFWVAVLVWGALVGVAALLAVSAILLKINTTGNVWEQLSWSFLAYLIGWTFVAAGTPVSLLIFSHGPEFQAIPASAHLTEKPLFSLILSFFSSVPALFYSNIVFLLILLRLILKAAQRVLLNVFNVASSPRNSPFAYLCSLLGIGVFGIKLIKELVAS